MVKKIRNYILLAAVTLSVASCLDKLSESGAPFDNTIRSVSDTNQAVVGICNAFKSSALYSDSLTLLPDLQADLVYVVNGYTNTYDNIWRWEGILATNTDIEAVYQALCTAINCYNSILDHMDYVRKNAIVDVDLDKLDQYCGEAYFTCAFAYSELIKLFCKVYESDEEAAGELGVILAGHYSGGEEMKCALLKDSYQFVLDGLDHVTDPLKLEDDFKGTFYDATHFNEYVVYALRARIALYMKKWDDATKYSGRVIESNYYALASCTRQVLQGVSYY